MFDRVFQRPHVVARHQKGPLAKERLLYLAHHLKLKMAPLTLQNIARYVLVVTKALRLADRPGELITQSEIDGEAERWANSQPKQSTMRTLHRVRIRFKGHAIRWLTFLGRLQRSAVVQRPDARQVAQGADHQLRERGLSPMTGAYCSHPIFRLLAQVEETGFQLKTLNMVQVDELLAKQFREEEYARTTICGWASVLRTFFRFAEQRGWCRQGLAEVVRAPRIFTHAGLPIGLSWDDVKRLLAATARGLRVDIRDRAILMLLAVYGLRVGEVAALCLKDFDWEREILHVPHSKSRRQRIYPLCRPVGDAVLRYLREVRPRSDKREMFLAVMAPFRPMAAPGMSATVQRRLHALGLSLPHYGPHMLRHACATHLLAQGLSLKEVGDHLGHRSPETTRIYAKVDLAGLRSVSDFSLEDLL